MYITKTVYGFTYYLRRESNGRYTWQGLRDNGTLFTKEEYELVKLKIGL